MAGYYQRAEARKKIGDHKGAEQDEFKIMKKQGVALKNEMSNYTNSLRSIRDVLLDNENYTKSPLYKRLERDIERYIARTIWNMKRNGEIRDASMIGIIHKLRTGQQ